MALFLPICMRNVFDFFNFGPPAEHHIRLPSCALTSDEYFLLKGIADSLDKAILLRSVMCHFVAPCVLVQFGIGHFRRARKDSLGHSTEITRRREKSNRTLIAMFISVRLQRHFAALDLV